MFVHKPCAYHSASKTFNGYSWVKPSLNDTLCDLFSLSKVLKQFLPGKASVVLSPSGCQTRAGEYSAISAAPWNSFASEEPRCTPAPGCNCGHRSPCFHPLLPGNQNQVSSLEIQISAIQFCKGITKKSVGSIKKKFKPIEHQPKGFCQVYYSIFSRQLQHLLGYVLKKGF